MYSAGLHIRAAHAGIIQLPVPRGQADASGPSAAGVFAGSKPCHIVRGAQRPNGGAVFQIDERYTSLSLLFHQCCAPSAILQISAVARLGFSPRTCTNGRLCPHAHVPNACACAYGNHVCVHVIHAAHVFLLPQQLHPARTAPADGTCLALPLPLSLSLPLSFSVYLSPFLSLSLSLFLYIYIYMCVCVCVEIHMYTHTHTHTHTETHTYVYRLPQARSRC